MIMESQTDSDQIDDAIHRQQSLELLVIKRKSNLGYLIKVRKIYILNRELLIFKQLCVYFRFMTANSIG